METSRAEYLFQKLVEKQCTDVEKAELLAGLEKGDAALNAMLDSFMAARDGEYQLPDAAADGIVEAIFQAEGRAVKMPLREKKKRWAPVWVAAAVLLPALSAGIWMLVRRDTTPAVAVTHTTIQPGTDKAVLVLEDGQEIALSGTESGAVAGSNGAVTLKNGVLQYHYREIAQAGSGYHTLSTPRGGKFQLVLPDGTHVWLNAASAIRFPVVFTGKDRMVELRGEAYFDVTPKAESAFSVKAANVNVKVLGTGFNIMAYEDEGAVKTTLAQGIVKVDNGKGMVQLKPGELAEPVAGGDGFEVRNADMDVVLAWKEDKFRFKNADIKTIMRQVARWYNIEVNYEGAMNSKGLTGTMLRKGSIEELLGVLEETGYVHFTMNNDRVTVFDGPAS